ncbi:hypothetical protein R50072_25900 [Simiduia litorea]|uniref:GIN domain-containing protein n=1 Tax=Simiduia litorea TaxID=1435348 RepID=UPI0036F3B517
MKIFIICLFMSALSSAWVYGDSGHQQQYLLSPTKAVKINAFGKVEIQGGQQNQLTLIAAQDISPYIEITAEQGHLSITDTRLDSFWFQAQQLWWRLLDRNLDQQPITYQLTLATPENITLNGHLATKIQRLNTPNLSIYANGLGEILLENLHHSQLTLALNGKFSTRVDNLSTDTLEVSFNGTGDLKTNNLFTDQLHASINGSIDSHLAGQTTDLHLQMDGSSKCQGQGFSTDRAYVLLSDNSQLTLKVNQQLHSTSEDESRVFYYGNPETQVKGNAITHLVGGYQAKIYY